MLHRVDVQNNVAQSNTIEYWHVIAYYYLPLLYLYHKRRTWTYICAAIAEGAAQQHSFIEYDK